jgi:hypothetical protein
MPNQVQEIGGIFAVMDGESRIEADPLGVLAQEPRADAVKRAGPGQRLRDQCGLLSERAGGDALDPPRHLGRRAAGEGEEQDAARIDAVQHEMRDAMRKRIVAVGYPS